MRRIAPVSTSKIQSHVIVNAVDSACAETAVHASHRISSQNQPIVPIEALNAIVNKVRYALANKAVNVVNKHSVCKARLSSMSSSLTV